jgi:penicillin-binding protein 1A
MKNLTLKKKIIVALYGTFATGVILIVILFALISTGMLGFMPSFEELENPQSQLATEIFAADGKVLGNFFSENRSRVDYREISPNVINALIATEDIRFHDHSGIDARGLARVLFVTILLHEENSGGGSTITQQLAKLLFHDPATNMMERALQKLKEWVIAIKLERSYTKEEILTMYLNKAPFIYDAYGIKSAASTFFGKSPSDLKTEEAAVLIGMLKNPSLFNPVRRPELTLKRRNVVLHQMMKAKSLTKQTFDSLKVLPLQLEFQRADHLSGLAPYFREYLRLTLIAEQPVRENYSSWQGQKFYEDSIAWNTDPLFGWVNKNLKADGTKYDIYRDGLKIYTTIDSHLQTYAEKAVTKHLGKELQPQFFKEKEGRIRAPFSSLLSQEAYDKIINKAIWQTDRYRILKRQGTSDDSIKLAFKKPIPMRVFSYHGEVDTIMSPLDSIHYYKSFLRASLFSMDPHSGYVRAYVGGPNYKHFKYDMATLGKRQVGSTIKPFVYTLAMQEGLTPCDMVPNIPQTFYLPTGQTWTPRNAGSNREGEMVSLKWGLAQSNNNITAWIMKQYTPEAVVRMIQTLGIKSHMDAVPALALGATDIGLSEMVAAYATYANKGVHTEPLFVTRIDDRYGNVISTFSPRKKEAINESNAYLMINLLEGVVNTGTAYRLRYRYQFKAEIGGKTGTTQHNSDGWFIGVTPNLVTGIWVGGEERDIHFDNTRLGQGANMALPIWAEYMKPAYGDPQSGVTEDDLFEKPNRFNVNLNCPDEYSPSSNDKEVIESTYQNQDNEFY